MKKAYKKYCDLKFDEIQKHVDQQILTLEMDQGLMRR